MLGEDSATTSSRAVPRSSRPGRTGLGSSLLELCTIALPLRAKARRAHRAGSVLGVEPAHCELEPDAGAALVVHAPARGEPLDQMEPESACHGIGGASADRTVAMILDFHPNDAFPGAGADVNRRTDGLTGVPDAVGDELRYEQAHVSVKVRVPSALEPSRHDRAREKWRAPAAGYRGLADADQRSRQLRSWASCVKTEAPQAWTAYPPRDVLIRDSTGEHPRRGARNPGADELWRRSPSCWRRPRSSLVPQCSTILPSAIRQM